MNAEANLRKGNGQLRVSLSITRSACSCATFVLALALILSFVSTGNRWLTESTRHLFEEVVNPTFPRGDSTFWYWR